MGIAAGQLNAVTVGASLLAMAVCQAPMLLKLMPSSLASQLPQGLWSQAEAESTQKNP
jgi:hypothetical protein